VERARRGPRARLPKPLKKSQEQPLFFSSFLFLRLFLSVCKGKRRRRKKVSKKISDIILTAFFLPPMLNSILKTKGENI
ncbi:MAG: hypothetical protein J6P03_04560, partial [Opitutales bacterium]|nr:hypothetical protein [Opitutales bacterium]